MDPRYPPPGLGLTGDLALALFEAAARAARAAARRGRRVWRGRRWGHCLAPGPQTPLWNELLARTAPQVRRWGQKAQLARLLGLPRQRLHDVLKARTACLDAERTLWLFCWVIARERGEDLGG